jgi:hypothetical protein
MVPWQISPLDTPCRLDYLRNHFILGTIFIPSLARGLIDLDWLLAHQHYDCPEVRSVTLEQRSTSSCLAMS